jgi:NitT/TauT family transport system permease protein
MMGPVETREVPVTAAVVGPLRPRRKRLRQIVSRLSPLLVFAAVIGAWELWVRIAHTPLYILPPPSRVAVAMVTQADALIGPTLATAREVVLGFLLSVAIGIPLAVMLVSWRVFERAVYPFLVASQVIPKVAIAPLLIVWFGFGFLPKVLVAFLIAFFPIVMFTITGLRSFEIEKTYLARSMGAGWIQTFWRFRLPNALPSILSGMKVAATFSVIGAIIGEFIGADQGIARVLLQASGVLDTVRVFASLGYITILGVVMFSAVGLLERLLIPWDRSRRFVPTA